MDVVGARRLRAYGVFRKAHHTVEGAAVGQPPHAGDGLERCEYCRGTPHVPFHTGHECLALDGQTPAVIHDTFTTQRHPARGLIQKGGGRGGGGEEREHA